MYKMAEPRKFIVESSPHIHKGINKSLVMWFVILALIPSAVLGVINFGIDALLIILTAVVTAALTEAFFYYIKKQDPLERVFHGSSILTGLLIGMIIPPTVPLWIPAIGSFVAIALAKHAFGGAGMTMFNPALVGRAFLVASFPVIMTRYAIDGITSATPLTALKLEGYETVISQFGGKIAAYKSLLFGNILGSIGETSALALLIGGLFLIIMKIIDWKIPVIYIGTVFVLTFVLGHDPIFHILAGGLFIGAFFMATGYEGMPINKMGRVYFALGCGILTVVIRLYGGYPEGVNYSILLMNAASPLIERLTMIRPFGYKKVKNG